MTVYAERSYWGKVASRRLAGGGLKYARGRCQHGGPGVASRRLAGGGLKYRDGSRPCRHRSFASRRLAGGGLKFPGVRHLVLCGLLHPADWRDEGGNFGIHYLSPIGPALHSADWRDEDGNFIMSPVSRKSSALHPASRQDEDGNIFWDEPVGDDDDVASRQSAGGGLKSAVAARSNWLHTLHPASRQDEDGNWKTILACLLEIEVLHPVRRRDEDGNEVAYDELVRASLVAFRRLAECGLKHRPCGFRCGRFGLHPVDGRGVDGNMIPGYTVYFTSRCIPSTDGMRIETIFLRRQVLLAVASHRLAECGLKQLVNAHEFTDQDCILSTGKVRIDIVLMAGPEAMAHVAFCRRVGGGLKSGDLLVSVEPFDKCGSDQHEVRAAHQKLE